jgi:hypothetical protein
VSEGRNRLFRLYSSSNWYRDEERRTTICGSFYALYSAFSSNRDDTNTSSILTYYYLPSQH